jgi:hypothetical protein
MDYESVREVPSLVAPGVTFEVRRMSFGRRLDLMRLVRDLARRIEFLESGEKPAEKMDAALARAEIDRLYAVWGLGGVKGLNVDGATATPEMLADKGPEEVFREAVGLVRTETGLSEEERKN